MMSDGAWKKASGWEQRFRDGDTPWDLEAPSETLVGLEAGLRAVGVKPGRALVPGCGVGNDALFFARRGYSVTAADWSATALARLAERALAERLSLDLRQGDFFQAFAGERAGLDLWVEHTFFCAIDPSDRPRYVESASRLLRPGGHLIANFFVSPERLENQSLGDGGEGPPFRIWERELRELFSPSFEWLSLAPTVRPHPERRPGMEWAACLRRK
jgi:SAM-dependent methyltransferase